MANQQHIEWLLEGVEAWNARREREDFVPDFEGANFRGADLEWANLAGASLERARLRKANLAWANLEGAYLGRARLEQANLEEATLEGAHLKGAKLDGAHLKGAKLDGAQLKRANFRGADLGAATLKGAKLEGANLAGANLGWAKFGGADLGGAIVLTLESPLSLENSATGDFTDLSLTVELTQAQLDSMLGDSKTRIPGGLKHPAHWPQYGAKNPKLPIIKGVMAAKEGAAPEQSESSFLRDHRGNVLRDSRGAALQATGNANSEKVSDRGTIKNARTKLASVTPIADVEWTETGHLKAELKPIQPQPRQPVPTPNPAAVIEQIRGVLALSKQLRQQIENSTSPNAAPFIGDAGKIFVALETQLAKGQSELIPVVVKANVAALKAMGPSAEALAETEEAVYAIFIEEADKLLDLLPVLKIIENPYNEEIIPDEAVEPALDLLHQLDESLNSPEVIAELGPSLGGVTRDTDGFPWESDKQKIAIKSSFLLQVYEKLKNPPDYVNTAAIYITITTGPLSLILALFALLFP